MISLGSIGILMLISLVGAWHYRGKWYYIPILCGVVNLALNWNAFQYIVSPPWWAWLFPFLYAAGVAWDFGSMLWTFASGATVSAAVVYAVRRLKGVEG